MSLLKNDKADYVYGGLFISYFGLSFSDVIQEAELYNNL